VEQVLKLLVSAGVITFAFLGSMAIVVFILEWLNEEIGVVGPITALSIALWLIAFSALWTRRK